MMMTSLETIHCSGSFPPPHRRPISRRALQQQYVDDLMVTWQKPIMLISGNHEAYEDPYGISPRVGSQMVNGGIPADHNLSIYEACLLYGKDYAYVKTYDNFQKEEFEWFYQVFTPLSDFIVSHHQQRFVGLEWGNGEDIAETLRSGGGVLPRSEKACNDQQLQLVEQAANDPDSQLRLLLTHFTLVNFSTSSPLSERWNINTEDFQTGANGLLSNNINNGEEGSFYTNRAALYNDYIIPGHFKYCLAGHSHRAGLYQVLESTPTHFSSSDVIPEHYISDSSINGPRILVSGSGGPVAKQNYQKEIQGHGMDHPQGCWIDVTKDQIHTTRCTLPESQPRLAVALEYMQIMGDGFFNYLFCAEDELHTGQLQAYFSNTDLPLTCIETIKLHYVLNETMAYEGFVSWQSSQQESNVLTLNVSEGLKLWMRVISKEKLNKYRFYLSIHFNQTLAHQPAYQAYNTEPPWCFPVYIDYDSNRFSKIIDPKQGGLPWGWVISRSRAEPTKDTEYDPYKDLLSEYQA